jgi:hypothetical protein
LIANEIRQAEQSGYHYVFFIDETFNIESDHLDQLLQVLRGSSLTFGFQGRPDLMTEDLVKKLAEAGCVYAEFGVDVADAPLSRLVGRTQSRDRAETGLQIARSGIAVVRYNRLNFSTLDYSEMFPNLGGGSWDVPVDPIYPYPGTAVGDGVMARYGYPTFSWTFAQKYVWWLRMEVGLQRLAPGLTDGALRSLSDCFLALENTDAAVIARMLYPTVRDWSIHSLNKAIDGDGGELHISNTSA